MKHEIELPDLPDGFEYTGEFRAPKKGEWIWSHYKKRPSPIGIDYDCDPESDRRLIIKKVEKTAPASLLDRIKAEYGEYRVEPCKRREESGDLIIDIAGRPLHITAQSMKGFYRYVYEKDSGVFYTATIPVRIGEERAYHPVAVLFTKEEDK